MVNTRSRKKETAATTTPAQDMDVDIPANNDDKQNKQKKQRQAKNGGGSTSIAATNAAVVVAAATAITGQSVVNTRSRKKKATTDAVPMPTSDQNNQKQSQSQAQNGGGGLNSTTATTADVAVVANTAITGQTVVNTRPSRKKKAVAAADSAAVTTTGTSNMAAKTGQKSKQQKQSQAQNVCSSSTSSTSSSSTAAIAANAGAITDDADDHLQVKRKKLEDELGLRNKNGGVGQQSKDVGANSQALPAPELDVECRQLSGRVQVYSNERGLFYDAMLNQTNIAQNNNKFYLLQLLESKTGGAAANNKEYWVWLRWGRVGFKGQTNLIAAGSNLDSAIRQFHGKFKEKTANDFLTSRDSFNKVQGKYDLIRIDYTRKVVSAAEAEEQKTNDENSSAKGKGKKRGKKEEEEQQKSEAKAMAKELMDERVKTLMQTLCDLRAMESEAQRLDYDFKRIPLGKITKEQIRAGYEALTTIEEHIRQDSFGPAFVDAVSLYYTRIPHSFGMRKPPMITTSEQLKQEIDLLDLLTGIEIAVAEIAGDPLEAAYSRLKWKLVPVEKEHSTYELIEQYLHNTQGPTHNDYRLRLRNVFELVQQQNEQKEGGKGEKQQKQFKAELANKKLLWHGSRLTNWYSILAQGLRIAPPEAPVTGYMFGKGVYFADMSSKSANYSMPWQRNAPAYMMLSEVALGEMLDMRDADDRLHLKLPKDRHSVRGMGRIVPDPKGAKMLDDGSVEVPCGKPLNLADKGNKSNTNNNYSLIYNEYIVYSLEQIRERFLVEVGFEYEFDF